MTYSIQVEGLGKRYRRGEFRGLSNNFRESIQAIGKRLFTWRGESAETRDQFWALQDVNFEIKEGELVGVMGRNGAGKSTLLKILSRITPPTLGAFRYRGRLASLLEVGTGFHSQLTGRENVFLNGAILGLTRDEIRSKLDQIVDFSGVEAFLDTPVKYYSSGMYMRLAFSVAAHMETDILLVDEVLAVGDVEFQKRCTRRMDEVTQSGRTVVLVSHNLALMQHHCRRGIVIDSGRIAFDGPIYDAIGSYMAAATQIGGVLAIPANHPRQGHGPVRFVGLEIEAQPNGLRQLVCGQSGKIAVLLEIEPARVPIASASIALTFYALDGTRLVTLWSRPSSGDLSFDSQYVRIELSIPRVPLREGEYRIELIIESLGDISDWLDNVGSIEIAPGAFFRGGIESSADQGSILVDHEWRVAEGGTNTLGF